MPVCVKVIPVDTQIGIAGSPGAAVLSVPVVGYDATCSAGLLLVTQSEINIASDPERVADMGALFYAFLAVLVVVWGVKQLLNLFTGDTEK